MNRKRILSAALAAALAAGLALPVGAEGSSFTDVSGQTAVNADILRLMGVVDGVGGNRFSPQSELTRAQFCTMVVNFMQRGDEAPMHASRTIFSDVTAKHWGLAYINLAASLTLKDGERSVALVSGVGDGRFLPDARITLGEAVTILLRALGYTSQQTGTMWPQSYLGLASSIGLTDGLSAGAYDPIDRGDAAQLFVNALNCKTGSGEVYYKTLGTPTDGVIVLAVGVETDDGTSDGAIRTSANRDSESYLAHAGAVKPAALVGKRGALVLNDLQEIITFVPDDSTSVSVVLSGDARPGWLKGTDGKQYTMNKDTLLYTADSRSGAAYTDQYSLLHAGDQVILYSQRGKIVAVYAQSGVGLSGSGGAIVVTDRVSATDFLGLTGGADGYTVRKNRQTISLSQLQPGDVVTYDSLTNTLIASDLRLTCIYEDASPNVKAPTEIKVLGHSFPVLESAWEMTDDISLGSRVSLLLTDDGRVAGIQKAGNATQSNAIGLVTAGGAQLFLPNGGSLELSGKVSNEKLVGRLALLSPERKGNLTVSGLITQGSGGTFDPSAMRLGELTVTAGVRLFEQVDTGDMVPISMNSLLGESVPSSGVASYHTNTSGMVDFLVLKDVTGDAYQYGMMVSRTREVEGEKVTDWSLIRGSDVVAFSPYYGYTGTSGSFVAVTVGENSQKEKVVRSLRELTPVRKVTSADFFQLDEVWYVRTAGKSYRVSDDVECRLNLVSDPFGADNWLQQSTGEARLKACIAAADSFTVYLDPIASRVRIVSAD